MGGCRIDVGRWRGWRGRPTDERGMVGFSGSGNDGSDGCDGLEVAVGFESATKVDKNRQPT
jgi:hypothetical protein